MSRRRMAKNLPVVRKTFPTPSRFAESVDAIMPVQPVGFCSGGMKY